jgi:adenylylsulfate kinase-like enzyme
MTMTNDRPKMPPTDAQIIAEFIAEAAEIEEAMNLDMPDRELTRAAGQAAARRDLADRLAFAKIERAEYIKDAGERVASAFSDAGKKIAAALVKFNPDTDKEES